MRSAGVPGRCNGGPATAAAVPSATASRTTAFIGAEQAVTTPNSSFTTSPPVSPAIITSGVPPGTGRGFSALGASVSGTTSPASRSPSDHSCFYPSVSPRGFFGGNRRIRGGCPPKNATSPMCTSRNTPTKLTPRDTPRNSAPVSPRLVLPEGPETDLTDINSLLLDINQFDSNQTGGSGGLGEGIPLCTLSPGNLTARNSPPTSGIRRGGHSARGSLAEDDIDPETAAGPGNKAAQVSTSQTRFFLEFLNRPKLKVPKKKNE